MIQCWMIDWCVYCWDVHRSSRRAENDIPLSTSMYYQDSYSWIDPKLIKSRITSWFFENKMIQFDDIRIRACVTVCMLCRIGHRGDILTGWSLQRPVGLNIFNKTSQSWLFSFLINQDELEYLKMFFWSDVIVGSSRTGLHTEEWTCQYQNMADTHNLRRTR